MNGCLRSLPGLRKDPAQAASDAGVDAPDELITALAAAAEFTAGREEQQDLQLRRLADELPLRQVRVPAIPGESSVRTSSARWPRP